MLYTAEEIKIMSTALQPNMRNTKIGIEPYKHIMKDYLRWAKFKNKRILDIEPGQCDFLDLAKKAGAKQTFGCDFDPAVGELGQLRGHNMTIANLRQGWPYKGMTFDGIFCRGSINCCWFTDEEHLLEFLDDIAASLLSKGWLWIAPWNNPALGKENYMNSVYHLSRNWAKKNNISIKVPQKRKWVRYGIDYSVPQVEIWYRK